MLTFVGRKRLKCPFHITEKIEKRNYCVKVFNRVSVYNSHNCWWQEPIRFENIVILFCKFSHGTLLGEQEINVGVNYNASLESRKSTGPAVVRNVANNNMRDSVLWLANAWLAGFLKMWENWKRSHSRVYHNAKSWSKEELKLLCSYTELEVFSTWRW